MMEERIESAIAQAYFALAGTLIIIDTVSRRSELSFWSFLGQTLLAFVFYAVGAFIGHLNWPEK